MKPYASYKPSGVAWLGDVPTPWAVERLRFRVRLNPSFSKPLSTDLPVSFLPMEAIGDDGALDLERTRPVGEIASGYTYFEDGDVAIAKITPCYENGKGAVLAGLAEGVGFGTTELIVMRPTQNDCPQWLYYLTMCSAFRLPGEAFMQGAGGQKRVPDLFVKDYFAPIPPPDEQQAIADYLDTETARIDTLVQEKEELIGLLKEARSATITEAVSRGLCPSVPLKSSGLHFLGNVPKHWKKFKVAHAFGTSSGTTPPTDEPKWYEGDVPWVQSSELRENVVFSTEKKVTVEAVQKFSALKIYPAGTLLLAMYGATIGRVGLLGVPATTNQACCALHPLGEISTQFFCWWLQAYRDELVARGYGGGQPNISATLISGMYFFAPLPEEQQAIAEYLDDETAKIDALITHTQEEIALLKELRAATIADAVLGRVDVRTTVTKGVRRAENEL